jgi:pimeloyl-ACP methyl ester carboxylesterase
MASPWEETKADEKGNLKHYALQNGYALAVYRSETDRILLARGIGHYTLYVNGEAFSGDIYRRKYGTPPVRFRKGENRILVRARRGSFQLTFLKPPASLVLTARDNTLPDIREGQPLNAWGAILLLNASDAAVEDAVVEASGEEFETTKSRTGHLPPLGMRKVPFRIMLKAPLRGREEKTVPLHLKVTSGESSHALPVNLRFRKPGQTYKETFLSAIDRSVQYYAVRPPLQPPSGPSPLVLSCHGASVKAWRQADAYSPKPAGYVVAATNRRPFGFDWEDWGRMDALEVIDTFSKRYPVDPDRVYLTGHSMGGHGTWHIGVNHPGRFAAIGPSAGWISFATYSRRPQPKREGPTEFLARGTGPSDTLSLKENLRDLPVFIIHGSIDDNVPVRESRRMAKELATFHKDFIYREFEGKKHWWDDKFAAGTDCVDLPDLFDFFFRHKRPRAPFRLHFKTYNPAVSSTHRWLKVLGQETLLHGSEVTAEAKPGDKTIQITTKNITRLALDPSPHFRPGEFTVAIDGAKLPVGWKESTWVHLEKKGEAWTFAVSPPPAGEKRPERYGPFKQAFTNGFLFVYGTGGTSAENEASLSRARYDAQVWWYRGNGGAEILPDTHFTPEKYPDRNVILYGHAGMNRAYPLLLDDTEVRVDRGKMKIGNKVLEGDTLSCFIVRPRKNTRDGLVALQGGTGATGIRGTLLAFFFASGIHYPDLTVWGGKEGGTGGLRATGFFGRDWKVRSGEWWFSEGWKDEGKSEEEGF